MINYTWNCKTVDVHPIKEGQPNVVYNVHWIFEGIDTATSVSSEYIGTQRLEMDPTSEFIAFESLTNEIVTEWVKGAIGTDAIAKMEKAIASKISEINNPSSITKTLEN